MSQPILYTYWRSSASYRVRIALNLKKVSYEPRCVDIVKNEQDAPAYRAQNPMGYVPAFVHDGKTYTESTSILELLEETHPTPSLLPSGAHARARVRALVQLVNAGIQPLQNLNVLRRVSEDESARRAWAKHYNEKGLAAVETLLEMIEGEGVRGAFAYGDAPTLADVCLVPQVFAARRFAVDVDAFPRLARATQAAGELEAFKRAHPAAQPDAQEA